MRVSLRLPRALSVPPGRRQRRHAERLPGRRTASFERLEVRQVLATVSNTADSGSGSLRQAITDVNSSKVAETITFKLSGASTISLLSALPTLINPVGTTFAFDGPSSVTLDGSAASGADGLTIGNGTNAVSLNGLAITIQNFDSGLKLLGTSTGSTFKGLTLANNANGIELVGGTLTGTTIAANTITANTEAGILADEFDACGLFTEGFDASDRVPHSPQSWRDIRDRGHRSSRSYGTPSAAGAPRRRWAKRLETSTSTTIVMKNGRASSRSPLMSTPRAFKVLLRDWSAPKR